MKIAFLHYHLKPGGVTTVIRQQVEALGDMADILVAAGGPETSPFPAPVAWIQDLSYDTDGGGRRNPVETAEELTDAMVSTLGSLPDLVHVHNPTLAKNRHFLKILGHLRERGLPLLLQIHDFAEDGRPHVYYAEEAYPADVHYAVINQRDRDLLLHAGLGPAGLHYLPNPVRPVEPTPAFKPRGRILYPVRAIRRKNIGEALLLSLFFSDGETLTLTLPPNSPQDRQPYAHWKTFAEKQGLRVDFEAGIGADFPDLVAESRYVLTTSIAEGFGFAFLEPWTAGKTVWGRYLPGILADFESGGIRLDHLYRKIRIPTGWLGTDRLSQRFQVCLDDVMRRFGMPPGRFNAQAFVQEILADGTVDFGLLDEPFQTEILERIMNSNADRRAFLAQNPEVAGFASEALSLETMAANRTAVLTRYGMTEYRRRLEAVYRRVLAVSPEHRIDKGKLIERFLSPATFSLLKWCPYAD